MRLTPVLLLAAVAAVGGREQRVRVGNDPVLLNPLHANATVGDTIAFAFWRPGTNLSVVQSTLTRACSRFSGGFDSGWVQSTEDDVVVFRMLLTDDEPIFYYALNGSATAAEPQECTENMFGSLNASPSQIAAYKTLAVDVTAFPEPSSSRVSPISTGSSTPSATNNQGAAKDSDGDGRKKDRDGLSSGSIATIAICAVLGAGAVFWIVRCRRTRRAERRPRDEPPPAYVASIGAGSRMTEVWEDVGGRTVMRAPSMASQPGARATAGSTTGSRTASAGDTSSATLGTDPFASPEDDETATLRSPAGSSDEDAPPEYMSSHSVPPPFTAVARQ